MVYALILMASIYIGISIGPSLAPLSPAAN